MEQEKKRIKAFTHASFEDIFKSARKAIHDFAKPLIALMKVSNWNLDQAANAIENSVVYAKRSHKKYAFEAYVAQRITGTACLLLSLRRHSNSNCHRLQWPRQVACNGKEAKVFACIYHDKTQWRSTPYGASSLVATEVEEKSMEDTESEATSKHELNSCENVEE
ncbi:DUF641 domain-containing protein [Abeliophyllum distichum]|uniref:DUF641 domain-containing protein n=1 Tax=Abeliophyllum distichum TaxID=126358 RepID=A0ABD1PBB9_9LAMI